MEAIDVYLVICIFFFGILGLFWRMDDEINFIIKLLLIGMAIWALILGANRHTAQQEEFRQWQLEKAKQEYISNLTSNAVSDTVSP